jgi:predicted methyltransferase
VADLTGCMWVARGAAAEYGPPRMHARSFLILAALLVACGPKSGGPAEPATQSSSEVAPAPAIPAGDPALAAVESGDQATVAALRAALAGGHRSPENSARDGYRHPLETLMFFGLRQDMTVVELWPGGGGWYTEVLAPVLREKGRLIATNFDTSGPPDAYQTKSGNKYKEKLAGNPAVYDKVEVVTVSDPKALVLAPDGTVDLVVTFRNTHNWVESDIDGAIYGAAFKALKPGGVLGVEQHRAAPGPVADPKKQAELGYLPEQFVIERILSYGFKLAGKSEANANPRDTRDHEKGVWALPPSLDNGDKDRAKYLAIGESDRMTLKFVKP